MPDKQNIEIYTDGSCLGNPGPGGWGAVVQRSKNDSLEKISGSSTSTTNNRMELSAAIEALKFIGTGHHSVHIYTDSKYVKDGITKWIQSWKNNGWKTSGKKQVKNESLWRTLDALQQTINIEWHWVKGHADNKYNEMANDLAISAAKRGTQ